MNKSTFYGKVNAVSYNPEYKRMDISLSVEEIRKNSKGEKVIEYISVPLSAWDTAAETLWNYASPGNYLLVKDASFRDGKRGEPSHFRINDFKIIKVSKE